MPDSTSLMLQALNATGSSPNTAIHDLNTGKICHSWLWYTFPRLGGTGAAELSNTPALSNRYEAEEVLNHPVLGQHLRQATHALLQHARKALVPESPATEQIRSSLTLFSALAPGSIFNTALERLFPAAPCPDTQDYMAETDLQRFINAQDAGGAYTRALRELAAGRKLTHWMWYIFPTPREFARSEQAFTYGLSTPAEAHHYMKHPQLGPRLQEASRTLLRHTGADIRHIMGATDAAKLRTCMTVYQAVAPSPEFTAEVLRSFYAGAPCPRALEWLHRGS